VTLHLIETDVDAIPLTALTEATYADWLKTQTNVVRARLETSGFKAGGGTWCQIPGPDGRVEQVVAGLGDDLSDLWAWAALPAALPNNTYVITGQNDGAALEAAALGWALGTYSFGRFKSGDGITFARLVWPECDRDSVTRTAEATFLVRDLVNTPASHMGPQELAAAAGSLAQQHGADFSVIVGEDLLAENFPAIHAVGRASDRQPRLIDFTWGNPDAPKLTLIGKGVCFDSGGLDLKSAAGMKLMKKDMGGSAQVLGLASMIMAAKLPVRLRTLIPAVENSVSGNALRPLDVIGMRSGKTVEIGHTDAEGRVVLADALAAASEESPALIIDCATLTGAARVALGTDLPALFSNDDGLALSLLKHANVQNDPLWRMPLWAGYKKQVEGKVADLTNAPEGGYGGAITAALFLEAFVGPDIPWMHVDLMAWNLSSRPGRPEGGEAMGMRALFAFVADHFVS